MEADSESGNASFQLEPFIHQVGGHSSMLQLDKNTICKPLVDQELQFYQSQPESLKGFLPEFRGIVEVTYNKGNDGYLNLMAYQPADCKKSSESSEGQTLVQEKNSSKVKRKISMLHRIRVCHSGSILIECDDDGKEQLFEEGNRAKGQSSESLLNPWVLHCHQEQVKKMKTSTFLSNQKYILLENLTSKYEFPCILDLKMGTRPYGDDATAEKKQRQMANMMSTTSVALGVRIGGMQVYHHDSGHYICHNKYYGRGLTVDGFRQALYHFLHNGIELRKDILAEMIYKLCRLQEVIQSLDTFRFYTSSLLIIYDGKNWSVPEKCQGNCCCRCSSHCMGSEYCENDNVDEKDDAEQELRCDLVAESTCTKRDCAAEELTLSRKLSNHEECCDSLLDVKMIDFAHSTQNLMSGSKNAYVGPDDGYLFGLKSLIAQLRTFQEEND